MSRSLSRTRREYDRWLAGATLAALEWRFLQSVPGQVLYNTPALKLSDELRMKPEHRLLDVGCGAGSLLRMLDARVRFKAPPVGVDFSNRALRLGLTSALRAGDRPPDLVAATAISLPFADATFDFAISGHVLKHLPDWALVRMFREVRRVLKPGGLFVVWEFRPVSSGRLDAFNRWAITRQVTSANLRNAYQLVAAGRAAGYEWITDAALRPFLFPPIPRVSVLFGKAPEGWKPQFAQPPAGEQAAPPASA